MWFTRPAAHTTATSRNKFAEHISVRIQLINGVGGGGKEWEEQDFVDHSYRAAVSEYRTSCDKTRSATILLHASR